jgi:hypothetical protein
MLREGSLALLLDSSSRYAKGYNNTSFTLVVIFNYSLDSKL